MTEWCGQVAVEHLGAEGVLVDLGRSYLLSDHPPRLGGSGRGPTPGELLKGALSASAVLAIGAAAERGELPARSISVRCGFKLGLEDGVGPLAKLSYLRGFELDVLLGGALTDTDLERAEALVAASPIARLVAGDLDIEEINGFRGDAAGRPARRHVDMVVERSGSHDKATPMSGSDMTPATGADYIGGGRALMTWSGANLVIEDRDGGISPEHLMLAAHAVCTTVFAARAIESSGAAAEVRTACDARFGPDALAGGRLERRLDVIGDLTDEQRDLVAFMANHCAIGETLRRRAELKINVRSATQEEAAVSGLIACEDGACCVPEFAANA